ncbi:MAG: endolytic transglycosylase MltG [Clostridiales bacterium]|nr:endolytic transglycosylase MltG [Clostridiales bacterium]
MADRRQDSSQGGSGYNNYNNYTGNYTDSNYNKNNENYNEYTTPRSRSGSARQSGNVSSGESGAYRRGTSSASSNRSSEYDRRRNTGNRGNPAGQHSPASDEENAKAERRKNAKRKMVRNNAKSLVIILGIVLVISITIACVVISCINDVLAVHISEKNDKTVTVEIEEDMDTDAVIDALDDAGAIKNAWFCKLAAKILGYSDEGYIARTYEFNRSMGLENMLSEIKDSDSDSASTISLTFPEGYTADQILDMLEENGVCTREKLLAEMSETDYSDTYSFLKTMTNTEDRYILLEGYLFPDTYEFYIGESAESVIKKFLNNFDDKWSENYTTLAQEQLLSIDQVIILASIVEKEALDEDMPVVASILINRLNANMQLECNSTASYISNTTGDLTDSEKSYYNELYNTYTCSSFPVGAICNPGTSAIEAVLNAPDTSYYYFIHDSNNEFHAASSLSEQEANIAAYGLSE